MYRLAYEQLDRWRSWGVFGDQDIARMKEVELVSDLTLNFLAGTSGKTKKKLDDLYERYDDEFKGADVLTSRFRSLMDFIDEKFGRSIPVSAYKSEVIFFTLGCFLMGVLIGAKVG